MPNARLNRTRRSAISTFKRCFAYSQTPNDVYFDISLNDVNVQTRRFERSSDWTVKHSKVLNDLIGVVWRVALSDCLQSPAACSAFAGANALVEPSGVEPLTS